MSTAKKTTNSGNSKTMRHITIPALALLCLIASCQDDNDRAQDMLQDARRALAHHNYRAARDTILSMRKRYPSAIEARKQGILLLDTIELQGAKDSLSKATGKEWERLYVKQQFFQRKLEEDKKR